MKKKRAMLLIVLVFVVVLGYFFGRSLVFSWETDIPKLYFVGNIDDMYDKKDVRSIEVEYHDDGLVFSGYAELKVQGTSSLAYDKKNYTITFYGDPEHSEKLLVNMGWGEQSKYCLKANWIDKTHARNVVTAKLVTQMQEAYGVLTQAPRNGAIDGFPVEVYENGKFLGIYTWNIPKDEWQFGMDSDDPNHIVLCGEAWEDTNLFKAMPDFENWAVEVGEENDETLEKMDRLFDFVINSSDEEFRAEFENYLDLDAALNYYVMADVAFLRDNKAKNILLATYDGEIWYLSLYDLDTSWGTSWDGKTVEAYGTETTLLEKNNLFWRMEQQFGKELAERYFELRGSILSKEHIMGEFNAFAADIPEVTFVKETLRWGLDIPGYDYAQIEDYLDTVLDRLDEKYAAWLEA